MLLVWFRELAGWLLHVDQLDPWLEGNLSRAGVALAFVQADIGLAEVSGEELEPGRAACLFGAAKKGSTDALSLQVGSDDESGDVCGVTVHSPPYGSDQSFLRVDAERWACQLVAQLVEGLSEGRQERVAIYLCL